MKERPGPIRVAVVCDYPEEGWASMDLTAEMVLDRLTSAHPAEVVATRVCPPFRPRLTRLPTLAGHPVSRNADRLFNRFVDYPRALSRIVRRGDHDLYHLIDHSYSQLVHTLPSWRSVVTCHDLDTFRCLFEPEAEPRPRWFRAMARRILGGFRKAAAVTCNSTTTRDAILSRRLLAPDRLAVVPMGVHPAFSPDPDPAADAEAARRLGPAGPPELLHVGSTIPRKRIDVLLDVFAEVRRTIPAARLVKVGGTFTTAQERQARDLGLTDSLVPLPFLPREVLAAVYRRASLVLQPSEAEGFGLPAIEALACGAPLLASDLPALREVACAAAVYRPVGDVPAWVGASLRLLDEHRSSPDARLNRRALGLSRARLFSWSEHASRLVGIYREVLSRPLHPDTR